MKSLPGYVLAAIVLMFCLLGQAHSETINIKIKNFNFYPPDPVINVGDTVVWENTMNYGHWVISGVDILSVPRVIIPITALSIPCRL